ncbi:MAG: AbrB/MazE/SpoVT family DNA-binding domain-containing protein [Candidatus Acidiferrales bacterium]
MTAHSRKRRAKTNEATVTVSPKFQIVIPKEVRERLDIRPGQQLLVYAFDGTLRLELPRPISELRGSAKGIRWEQSDRDHSDRL